METLCHSEKLQHPQRRPWLSHEVAQLREMYERGVSVNAIAQALNVSEARLRKMASRARIFRSPEAAAAYAITPSWLRIRAALQQYGQLTMGQIHEFSGVSLAIIGRELKLHRAELRIEKSLPTGGRCANVWELLPIPSSPTA